MIRHFCDGCEKELEHGDHERLAGEVRVGKNVILVEVISGVGSTWNSGQVCHVCILTALMALKESHPTNTAWSKQPEKVSASWSINREAVSNLAVLKRGKS